MPDEKEIVWVGTSLDDLREFPRDARQDTGFQLEQVQFGRDPDHWKPMPAVGPGCREIRISTGDGIFRVFYVTQFGDEIYVLHCFTKKTQKTSKKDIDIGERRYKVAKRMHEQRKVRNTMSVWDDIADSREEAENLKLRAALIRAIRDRIDGVGWSQSIAAQNLGLTQPRVSDLYRGKISKFSLDALVEIASKLGIHVRVEVDADTVLSA